MNILFLCLVLVFGSVSSMVPLFHGEYVPDGNLALTVDNRSQVFTLECRPAGYAQVESIMQSKKVARIISYDGGGIRGLIPARWSSILEQEMDAPISSQFHMLAGTSTGGIIATGLAARKPEDPELPLFAAKDICDMYRYRGSAMFRKRSLLDNFCGISKSKYRRTPAYENFREFFGDLRLSDIKDNDVLVTYYDLTNRRPRFFKSHRARNRSDSILKDYYLRDVLAATTAAPTYFEPFPLRTFHNIETGVESHVAAIDGGVFANDPTGCALMEAISLYPNAEAFFVLSMGTGSCKDYTHPKSLLSWARSIPGILMGNASEMNRYMMKELGTIASKPIIFSRLQTDLPKAHSRMDKTSSENLGFLYQKAGEDESEVSKIEALASILRDNPITDRSELVSHISASCSRLPGVQ